MALDQMEGQLSDMFHDIGPEPAFSMAQIVEKLTSLDKKDAISATGYGVAGVSAAAATGEITVNTINRLMRELYNEAIEKFGKKAVHTAKAKNLKQMEHFLKGHPKYLELMKHLKKLPKLLLPKGGYMTVNPHATYTRARFFRKQVSLPFRNWNNSSQYVSRMAKQLNGRVKMFKSLSRGATWYVPALLGVASVAAAPPENRIRTLFEEGFGVLGGAAGTFAGGAVGLGIVIVLGLGPVGLFVAAVVCTTIGGIAIMKRGQRLGGIIYDYGSQLGNGKIYHSPEELIEVSR
jgi:hypothetical protein